MTPPPPPPMPPTPQQMLVPCQPLMSGVAFISGTVLIPPPKPNTLPSTPPMPPTSPLSPTNQPPTLTSWMNPPDTPTITFRKQINNIVWGNMPIYWLQDGWPVDIVLQNNVLINEHCASRCPKQIANGGGGDRRGGDGPDIVRCQVGRQW